MHVDLHERRSVIFFDEVQLEPKARQAIKHLVKDGRYDYIETGSLLSLKKKHKKHTDTKRRTQNIHVPDGF